MIDGIIWDNLRAESLKLEALGKQETLIRYQKDNCIQNANLLLEAARDQNVNILFRSNLFAAVLKAYIADQNDKKSRTESSYDF